MQNTVSICCIFGIRNFLTKYNTERLMEIGGPASVLMQKYNKVSCANIKRDFNVGMKYQHVEHTSYTRDVYRGAKSR